MTFGDIFFFSIPIPARIEKIIKNSINHRVIIAPENCSLKQVIKYNVILWGDVPCFEVLEQLQLKLSDCLKNQEIYPYETNDSTWEVSGHFAISLPGQKLDIPKHENVLSHNDWT